jgi:hypothetical protein
MSMSGLTGWVDTRMYTVIKACRGGWGYCRLSSKSYSRQFVKMHILPCVGGHLGLVGVLRATWKMWYRV